MNPAAETITLGTRTVSQHGMQPHAIARHVQRRSHSAARKEFFLGAGASPLQAYPALSVIDATLAIFR